MKLVTYLQNSTEHLGVLTADETGIVPAKALGLHFADMAELAVTMTDRQRDAAAAVRCLCQDLAGSIGRNIKILLKIRRNS